MYQKSNSRLTGNQIGRKGKLELMPDLDNILTGVLKEEIEYSG